MPGSQHSIQTVYEGQTPSKPGHHLSTHSAEPSSNGSEILRHEAIKTFMVAPDSTPLPSIASAQEIVAAHQARVAAQINGLVAHLP